MGYCISLQDADFRMKAENKEPALQALKAMWDPRMLAIANPTGGRYAGGEKVEIWYSWMNNTTLRDGTCESFEQGMTEWRYPVDTDDNGDVIGISFEGEKIGDEDRMFAAIAPFVEDGSYIEMDGEDGAMWRWVFKNGEMREVNAVILWPDA